MGTEIRDYQGYTTKMQKSMYDKMFFVDKVFDENIDAIIDFGCADGELILHLHTFWPNVRYIGYDIDSVMLKKAKEKVGFAEFYNKWDDIQFNPETTLLNLSSVLHEVEHYSTEEELKAFWNLLLHTGFKYITVRDMFSDEEKMCSASWKTNVKDAGYQKELEDFEKVWGDIATNVQKMHFLLKYRYKENWGRELHENYFPMSKKVFLRKMVESGDYQVEHCVFSSLPYIVFQVKKELGLNIANEATHLRVIFKKKDRRA